MGCPERWWCPSLQTPMVRGWALSTDGAVGVPALCRVVGPDSLQRSLPTQTILWLYENREKSHFHLSTGKNWYHERDITEEHQVKKSAENPNISNRLCTWPACFTATTTELQKRYQEEGKIEIETNNLLWTECFYSDDPSKKKKKKNHQKPTKPTTMSLFTAN